MEKRVIDISPPGKKKEKEIREELPPVREPSFSFKRPEIKITAPKLPFNKVFLVIAAVLIIIGVIVSSSLSRAEIEIKPEIEILTFKTKATVDKSAEAINFLDKVVPGKIFQTEKTVSGDFSSSGEMSEAKKAEGTIKIYNNYNSPQVLVAQTRFQAPLEKFQPSLEKGENPWFRTVERVVIPTKGQVDVKVIADSPGEKYNIEASTFSVPGLAGTPQYTFVYGKSSESIKGGMLARTSQVTQEDLDKAKESLTEKAKKECNEDLKNKISADFAFLAEATTTEIIEASSLAKPGVGLEKFNYQVKARSLTLAFKVEDLKKFANEFILSQVPDNKVIYPASLKVNYFLTNSTLEAGKIILSLDLEAKIYSDIDETALKRALEKKSAAEAKLFLEGQPEISEAKIKLWPFWVKEIPAEEGKVKITLKID